MTLSRSNPRARQRWTLLGAVILVMTLFGALASQAALNTTTLFELDRDATDDIASVKIGLLNSAVSDSTTANTIQVCQNQSAAHTGTILIDAERMTLGSMTNLAGGGCPDGFTFKRSYAVTRPVDGTVRGAHAKAEDVTLLATSAHAGDDWDDVSAAIAGGDDDCSSLGAVECTFTHDERATSIFTSSKDYDELNLWQWRDQSVPDANELDDGFAVKYIDGSGDQHVYFGADRFATEGSKDAGFWFFKDDVGTVDPVGNADGTFIGAHTAPVDNGEDGFCNPDEGGLGGPSATPNCARYDDNDSGGDVLILTTFTGGGAVTTIRVYEWIGPAGSTAALLERSTSGDCSTGTTTSVCATVNNTTIESAWAYSGKNEPALDEIASGGFLEGGVNLSDLGLEGCFSSFMATTRSAPSLTADPKDFILGEFEACTASLTTTPKTGAGAALTADSDADSLDEITIGVNGQVTVTDSAALTVNGTTTFSGDLNFYLCGPFATPNACSDAGVEVGAASGVNPVTTNGTYASAPAVLTQVGRYCWYATFESATKGLEDGAADGTIESAGSEDPPIPYSTGECFEVMPVAPTLTTQASNNTTGTAAIFGTAIDDTATLTGTARKPVSGGPNSTYPTIHTTAPSAGSLAGGSITFRLYGPSATASCVDPATGVTGNLVGSSVVTVSGDSVAGPPATYKASTGTISGTLTPTAPGHYWWRASYSGDTPNTLPAPKNSSNAAIFTACGDTGEDSFVAQIPTSILTDQWVYPNDDATISATAGGDLVGSLQFRLFSSSATCLANTTTGVGNGGLLYQETIAITDDNDDVSGADSETRSTANVGTKVHSDARVYWRVLFTSTNSAHESRLSNCTEDTQLTFTGDNTGTGVKP